MKNQLALFIWVISFACFIFSCKNQERAINVQLLKEAGQLVEEQPDSTLTLLGSIEFDELSEAQYYDFVLLQVQAKDKADLDIASEIDIFRAVDYFVDRKDSKRAALAYFYAGKVHQARNAYQNVITAYLEALKYVEDTEGLLKGMIQNNIGHLHYNQMYLDEAADWFRKAYHSYKNEENSRSTHYYKASVLISMGNVQMLAGVTDSALFHYQIALDIAHTHKDTTLQIWAIQNIGYTYHDLQDYNNAKKEYSQAIKLSRSEHERTMPYLNIIQTLFNENKMDSVHHYKNLLDRNILEIKDTTILASVYQMYTKIEEQNGNFRDALYHAKKQIECIESLYEGHINQSVIDVQNRYNFETVLDDKNKLLTRNQNRGRWIFGLVVTIFIFTIFTAGFHVKKIKAQKDMMEAVQKKELMRKLADEELARSEEEKSKLEKGKNTQQMAFHRLLAERFDINTKIVKLSKLDKVDLNIINSIIYSEGEKINYSLLNHLAPELFVVIDELEKSKNDKSGKLNETERCICCMYYYGFDALDIGTYFDISINTIYSKTTSIRKKLQINKGGDIKAYFDQLI